MHACDARPTSELSSGAHADDTDEHRHLRRQRSALRGRGRNGSGGLRWLRVWDRQLHLVPGVSDIALAPDEIEAIQALVRDSATSVRTAVGAPSGARSPESLQVWGSTLVRRAHAALEGVVPGGDLPSLSVTSRPTTDANAWRIAATAAADVALEFGVDAALVTSVAAARCGLPRRAGSPATPTPLELRLFEPAACALRAALRAAWHDHSLGDLVAEPAGPAPAPFEPVAYLELQWTGEVHGTCSVALSAKAATLLATTLRLSQAALARNLARVEVDVVVELGRHTVESGEPWPLVPGQELVLSTLVGARLPIYVGGVLKAWGTPVVSSGVLAVQLVELVPCRGSSSSPEGRS